ncbi:hypothetical protein [Psychrobacter ciconiae]|uniref:hypothetical protein n=1 Tax=Psychrobacter ciconiae TaxID=1553449 RepID=UPI001917E063|nr:hypothetical protein [Psychrobacter ciconiae]
MKLTLTASLLSIVVAFPMAATAHVDDLERGLLKSMTITIDRDGNIIRNNKYSGAAIRSYKKLNFIKNTPDLRYDYTDNYLLRKPASLLGHDLKIIEEEYMGRYIGCCVSEGVGAVIRQQDSLSRLNSFAKKNRCSIERVNFDDYLRAFGIKNPNPPRGNYYSISCRDRDLAR